MLVRITFGPSMICYTGKALISLSSPPGNCKCTVPQLIPWPLRSRLCMLNPSVCHPNVEPSRRSSLCSSSSIRICDVLNLSLLAVLPQYDCQSNSLSMHTEQEDATHSPLRKSQLHLSPAFSCQSLIILQASSDDSSGD